MFLPKAVNGRSSRLNAARGTLPLTLDGGLTLNLLLNLLVTKTTPARATQSEAMTVRLRVRRGLRWMKSNPAQSTQSRKIPPSIGFQYKSKKLLKNGGSC